MRLVWVWLEQDVETADVDRRELAMALNTGFDPASAAALFPAFNAEHIHVKGLSDGAAATTLKDAEFGPTAAPGVPGPQGQPDQD
eukprot:6540235-Pyramimonas_sp.AAC.1